MRPEASRGDNALSAFAAVPKAIPSDRTKCKPDAAPKACVVFLLEK